MLERTDPISIRRAKPEDAGPLCQAEYSTSQQPGLLVSRPHELSLAAFSEKIDWLDSAGLYLVAEMDGRPVGHASLEPLPLQAMSHVFSLTIVVHPGNAQRGVGTVLMESLLAWAIENHVVEKIELRVREGNHVAQRLYERFGFTEEGRFEKRIKIADGAYLADISMARFVRP